MQHISRRSEEYSFFNFSNLANKAVKWGPQIIICGLAGYYSLGWAYKVGLMAAIDRIVIPILIDYFNVGYIALGALMPTIQWYSAWTVRITAALIADAIYELILLIFQKCLNCLFPGKPAIPNGGIPLTGLAV